MHKSTINPHPKTLNNFKNPENLFTNKMSEKQNCLHLKVPTKFIKISIFLFFINVKVLNALKCVCNVNDCDIIKADQCPGRGVLIWDPCRCCKVCAKTIGETCGGPGGFSGTCEPPLRCISKPPIVGTGICLELPSSLSSLPSSNITNKSPKSKSPSSSCQEKIVIQPGCEIVDRHCQCWMNAINVCRESSLVKWDFVNIEECELNLANLVKSEVEFDEDYTLSPTSYELIKKLSKRRRKGEMHRHQRESKGQITS
ncbi:cysteine-rich motor neuron 1 protein [Chironomus tepperi]|uniref:cysteine-rich motor neuron 1 protein n=1 Tax=Chironomus tepperi TaxID=113505 RepID=UPI00391F3C23